MRKALFLDRDGVINKDYGYVHKKDNFEFIEGIFELIKSANNLCFVNWSNDIIKMVLFNKYIILQNNHFIYYNNILYNHL